MEGGRGGLTEEELHAFAAKAHEATVQFISTMASCSPEQAAKFLQISAGQMEDIQTFLLLLMDEKTVVEYPVFGIRLHQAGSKYVDYLAPKHMPRLAGGRWIGNKHSDLGSYMATMAMLTSIEGRAIMMAQGYRIEFLSGRFPQGSGRFPGNVKKNGKGSG